MSTTHALERSRRLSITVLAVVALLFLIPQFGQSAGAISNAQATTCSWQQVASPNTSSPFENELEAVLALSPTDAWAVGSGNQDIMIQHWDGNQWSLFPTPQVPGATQAKLLGIDAASPTDIWAVGYYIDSGWNPLALRYDGTQWNIVSAPSNLGTFNAPDILALNSVTVISANDVWAVGGDARSFSQAQADGGLQIHWDGSTWTPAFPPSGTGFGASLTGVTSIATDNVIAVGPAPPQSYNYDGTQWALVSGMGNNITAVDAANAQNIMAVGTQPGQYISSSGFFPPRARTSFFNGTGWSATFAPAVPGAYATGFKAVSALSPTEIFAVGYADDFTMAQFWNGSQWTIVTSANGNPNANPNRANVNELLGVDMLSSTDGWAVGYFYDETGTNGNQQTLILRYTCVGGPTPAPTRSPTTTPTPEPQPSMLFVSSTSGGNLDGVMFQDEDIIVYDGANWSMYFDGSDVGIGGSDVDAFSMLSDGSLLLSFNNPFTVSGIAADDSDILRFVPTSLGATTAGSFSMYVDGSDVGLTTNGEDIDSITVVSEQLQVRLLIGTAGSFNVPGASGQDEDLVQLTIVTSGNNTSGDWLFYFDGSDVGLNNTSDEDVWGASLVGNDLYLTTSGSFSVNGANGDMADVLECGSVVFSGTTCNFSLFQDGSAIGIGAERLDGLMVTFDGGVSAAIVSAQSVLTDSSEVGSTDDVDDTEQDDPDESMLFLPMITN